MTSLDTGTEQLLAELDEGVATITLNNPEKRNALSDQLTPALRQLLLELEQDARVRVVVITGMGKAFCAGGDVSGMGGGRANKPSQPVRFQDRVKALQVKQETLTLRLFELTKPTIAALPGAAAGAGCSIALACDLRIAAHSAFITTAFSNIGLSGDYGSSWLLPKLVGLAKAKELFYTSRRVGAEEGLALGLFNQVVPDEALAEATRTLALSIAQGPPIALGYMKENLNRSVDSDFRTCLAAEADRMLRSMQTQDHKEAVAAFMAKRPAEFHGH